MHKWKSLADRFLRLLYPVRCPFCDDIVVREQGLICEKCKKQLVFVKEPYCMKCGKPLRSEEQEYCQDCQKRLHYFERGRSLLVYDTNVRHSIYRFKYGRRKEYARAYAQLAVENLGDFLKETQADALVPVPLHYRRMQKRGYNQSQLWAREIGRRISIPVCSNLAKRVKNTIPQKQLDLQARQNNLKKAFKIRGNDVKLNTIIIVDDIYTTGSTIDALARAMRRAGVQKIYFLTLAGGES